MTVIRYFPAVFLLFAAGAKFLEFTPSADRGNPVWRLLQIETEALFVLCLLVGWMPRIIWPISIITFLFFAVVSLTQALSGETSCGCFRPFFDHRWCADTYGLG